MTHKGGVAKRSFSQHGIARAEKEGHEAYELSIDELRADRPEWFASRIDAYLARPTSGVSQALADEIVAVGLGVPMEVLTACQWAGTGTDVTADLAALAELRAPARRGCAPSTAGSSA